ncbi:MAG: hypothetical protein KF701_07700 [Anaerolineales bacterium]|nr:MAG: hypothetical protein KF701_07700 [Anaerolineales bacterium]
MNPVTHGLLKQLNDPQLTAFATDWDAVTELVIEIYQQKSLTVEQQARFFEAQERLQATYPALAAELEPFWRTARIKGELVVGDPFLAVLGKPSAKEFVENWDAMRTLPAAREALNMLLMARIEQQ